MDYPILQLQEMHILDHLMAFVICVIAPFVAFSSRKLSMEDMQFDKEDKIKLYHSNAMFLLIIGLVVISVWRMTGKTMTALGFEWPVWHHSLLLIFGLALIFYCLDIFFQYGLERWRLKALSKKDTMMMFVPSNASEFSHFAILAIAAGVGEEIIFRGFLIQYIIFWVGNDITGLVFAVVFSSAIFAFLHGYQGYVSMIKIFFVSMLLGAVFIISKSLIYVMIIHAIIDLVSGGVSAYFIGSDTASEVEE